MRDRPDFKRDFSQLDGDLAAGKLPSVSLVKAIGYKTEHPGYNSKLSGGVTFVKSVVDKIDASSRSDRSRRRTRSRT